MKRILSPMQMKRARQGLDSHQALIAMARQLIDIHERFLTKVDRLDDIIKNKVGPKGDKPSRQEILDMIRPLIPAPIPGRTPTVNELRGLMSSLQNGISKDEVLRIVVPLLDGAKKGNGSKYLTVDDIPHIMDKVSRIMPSNKQKEVDPMSVLDAISKIPDGKKIPLRLIDGLEQTISALHNQTRRGYLHGAGITALFAGSNISLSKDANGNYTISSTGGSGGGGSFLRQSLTGAINGVNTVFTVASPFVGSSFIDLNGDIQADGGVDYTYDGSVTITYNVAPPKNLNGPDTHYIYSGGGTTSSWVMDATPSGLVNGSNLVFTLPVNASQVVFYADGERVKGAGITYMFDGLKTITFTAGNAPGSTTSVDYLPS